MASPYSPSNIASNILEPLNKAARLEVWDKLFGDSSSPLSSTIELENSGKPYFEHVYDSEQSRLTVGFTEEFRETTKLAIKTHEELCDVVKILQKNKAQPKDDTIADLKAKLNTPDIDMINDTIDLALRTAYLVNARHRDGTGAITRSPTLGWQLGQSLQTFLQEAFPRARWQPKGKENLIRLNPCFTAAFMVDICQLKLEYTASLQEHLLLDQSGQQPVLRIFPYKACLNALLRMKPE